METEDVTVVNYRKKSEIFSGISEIFQILWAIFIPTISFYKV